MDEACSLHDAIVAANTDSPAGGCAAGAGADTIVLSGDVTLSEALPLIESVIVIEGGGHTISGDGKFRIFDVDGGSLTIRQLSWRMDEAMTLNYSTEMAARFARMMRLSSSKTAA